MINIPEIIIEIARDFFEHLSESQLPEFRKKYLEEQPFIIMAMNSTIKTAKSSIAKKKIEIMTYVTIRSFDYYDISLNIISEKSVRGKHLEFNKLSRAISGKSTDSADPIIKMLQEKINQPHLNQYYDDYIFGINTCKEPITEDIDTITAIYGMLIIADLLNDAIEPNP